MPLLCFVTHSYAQKYNTPVSLNELLSRVEKNAPILITDSAAIAVKTAQAAEIRSNWLPNLKLNYQVDAGTNNNVAGGYFGFGMVPSNSRGVRTQSKNNTALTDLGIAALDWEIYNFGAYSAENRVANSEIRVEQNRYIQSRYQLQAITIGDYLDLLRLQNYLNIESRNIERNQQIGRSIQALAKSGVRPGVDTSIAGAELSKARLNYIELDNQFKQVQLQLAAMSGLPYLSILPDTILENKLINDASLPMPPILDTADHPLINYYKSILLTSRQREELVKKQYNPKILVEAAAWGRGSSVDANDNFNNLSSGWGFSRNNYLIGVGITYNLLDLRHKQLKLNTQKSNTDYALKKLNEQKALLNLDISRADVELSTTRQRLAEIPNQLKAANAGYRQKLSLYKSGLTDIIELNAALNILYRAESDYVQAKYDYSSALFKKAVVSNQLPSVLTLLNY